MTNREVFEMQGNKTAQKEDILYSYELGPDGTYRLPSYLIRGIQTPGALVLLDEINTYPPEVLKLLNPLLDGRRYINDPQFGRISVHPSVLLV
jgi:MoxR-like ATPase